MYKAIVGIIILLLIIIGSVLFLHKDISKKPYYVSSEQCKNCHERYYNGWKNNTLHPKMFRPVRSPDDILGDFDSGDSALTFRKGDVEYVVGNKWEQVYVKKIDGEYYPLPAKWLIIKRKWVPYKVKDWKETPMSEKCNGCHTTGFDPDTFEFKEFGIGCEACHGPGGIHVQNQNKNKSFKCSICHRANPEYQTDIITSVSSDVCGQCHNRGTNISQGENEKTIFNFPIKYTPEEDIDKYFKQMTVEKDKKNKFWWGNGLSKNRHQEYTDWGNSKHAKALQLMKEKQTEDRGELADKCLKCHSTDYRFAKTNKKPNIDSAKYGVTCVACHDPHGFDKQFSFKRDGTYQCGGCHIDSMSFITSQKGTPHYPCPPGKVSCADCHMPYIVKTGGYFSLRSHALQIVPPLDTERYGMPNSCQNGNCHSNISIEWAKREFKKFYPAYVDNSK